MRYKLLNIVVDVDCKFEIFKFEYVDIKLRLEYISNTDKPDVVILPITFNELLHIIDAFNIVVPLTFKLFAMVKGIVPKTYLAQ